MKKSIVIIIILCVVMIIVAGFFIWKSAVVYSDSSTVGNGSKTVYFRIIDPERLSVENLKLGLWTRENSSVVPNLGSAVTNKNGVAIFKVEEGLYKMEFNNLNFPKDYALPPSTMISVKHEVENITIMLKPRSLASF